MNAQQTKIFKHALSSIKRKMESLEDEFGGNGSQLTFFVGVCRA